MLINNIINCEVKQSNLETSQLSSYDNNSSDNTSLNLLDTNNIKPETISTVANVILDCVDARTKKIITYKPKFLVANVAAGVFINLLWYYYSLVYAFTLLSYILINNLLMKRIKKITPVQVLKNRE